MPEPSSAQDAHDPYLAFRNPVYRRFSISYVLAVVGSQILATAIQWDIYSLVRTPESLAWIGGINALPLVLLSLPAGHLVDIVPRRRILILTQFVLIAVPWVMAMFVHTTAKDVRVTALLIFSGLNAITLTLARPARVALLPTIIPREIHLNAFTWNSNLFETSAWVGPAIAGQLLQGGVERAYWSSGLCMLVCMFLTLGLPNPPASTSERSASFETLLKGLKFVFRTPLLISALTLDLLAVLLGGAAYLLPVFAAERIPAPTFGHDWFATEEQRFGFLRAAPAFGAAFMAFAQAHYPMRRRAGRRLLWAVAGFGAATIVFGLSQNFWLSLSMLVLIGVFDNVSVVVRQTLVQSITPDSMRGRVSAVNQVFIGASNEIGGLESGYAAQWLGAVRAVVWGGVGSILVVIAVAAKWPQLRRLHSLHDLEPAQVEDEPRLGEPPV